MEPREKNQENRLDLMQFAGVLLGNIWIILLAGILAGLCGLFYTKMTATPTYTSSTKLYILNKSGEGDVTGGDLSFSATLAGDYAQLIKDRTVTESVISELGLTMSAGALAGKITVTMPSSGRIITISVTDTDPYMAAKLVTAVRDTAALHIKDVMGLDAVNVVEEANIPQGASISNYQQNGLTGMVIGMAAAIAIILFQFMMNDTIKTEEDVKRYLDMSVLGVIPVSQASGKRKKRKKQKKEKREDPYGEQKEGAETASSGKGDGK